MPAIRLIFLSLGAVGGVFFPFTAAIFAARGFDAAAIGLVIGVGAGSSLLAVPAWGHVGDVILGRRRALQVGILASAAALVAFGLPIPGPVAACAYIAISVAICSVGPMSDALAVNALRGDPRGDYGRVRLLTSLGFSVASIVAGFVFDQAGYGPAPFIAAGLLVLLSALAGCVPDVPRANLSAVPGGRRGGSARGALARQRRLPVVLLAIGLAFVGGFAVYTFMPLRLQELGGSPSDIALSTGLSAAAEVPGFLVAGWLAQRLPLRGLFALSVALSAACIGSLGALGSPIAIIVVRCLMGFAFAGLVLTSVVTVGVLLAPALQGTGQALLAATTSGLAAMIAGIAGGVVYAAAGSRMLFLTSAACTAAAAVLGWFVLPGQVRLRSIDAGVGVSGPPEAALPTSVE